MMREDERRARVDFIGQQIRMLEGAIQQEEAKWPLGVPVHVMPTIEGMRDKVRSYRFERDTLERPDLSPEQLKEYADRAWDIASRIEVDVIPVLRAEIKALHQQIDALQKSIEALRRPSKLQWGMFVLMAMMMLADFVVVFR